MCELTCFGERDCPILEKDVKYIRILHQNVEDVLLNTFYKKYCVLCEIMRFKNIRVRQVSFNF